MGRVGRLFVPISVKRTRSGFELLAGAHRIAAAERLAWDRIDAEIIDDENLARSLAASDNILRNHGTALSRADAWAEYVRSEFPKMKPRGGPHDKGLTKIANALGVSRRTLSRSLKWAGLSSSVKQMLFGNGLDRSATFLTELVEMSSEGEQIQAIQLEIGVIPRTKSAKERSKRCFRGASKPKAELRKNRMRMQVRISKLLSEWNASDICNSYESSDRDTQLEFVRQLRQKKSA
jgi:ParB-like chromosome segregation protein Spo0J